MIEALIFVAGLLIGSAVLYLLLGRNRFRLVRKRYAVTLRGGDGEFAGLLTEKHWDYYTFEHCSTVPHDASQQSQDIVGRIHVERAKIAYLQELPNDPV